MPESTAAARAAYLAAPVDERSRARLADGGLVYRLVSHDAEDYDPWLQVVGRGFLGGERTAEQLAAIRERSDYRRVTGVYDPTAPMPDAPVATIASWCAELALPGGGGIASSAISAVTVSPTHRRRGIARAMLEGELGAAVAAAVPVAMLTVSESTLYGRYGFGPAAPSASWQLDVKRASWTGPVPGGRVDFVPRETARDLAETLHARTRRADAGEVELFGSWWDNFAGTRPDAEKPGDKRAIRYADADGEVRGVAFYTVRENHDDWTKADVEIGYLLAETDDAYAALWRFFVELDLVGTVRASELSVDEPLWWMISDQRAATITVRDHQYVRILDVPAALEARRYAVPGVFALEVADPLGYAAGRYTLTVDAEGRGAVSRGGDAADGVPLALDVRELSAAYLGGVSLATLARAGLVHTTDAAAAARTFGWHRAPRLSAWY